MKNIKTQAFLFEKKKWKETLKKNSNLAFQPENKFPHFDALFLKLSAVFTE